MITLKNKILIYACGIVAGFILPMTVSFTMIFFFCDVNGHIPVKSETDET